ncbi:CubicO group peptidase (beta-lactamase class C family) [Flavobacterium sp. HSC-32F16]|uniref:serine hydrolase n=1 Tax=Flavobacterium sp. HSC-32F16 TaxID=2910964 RepID=UPI0020A59000|nr:serine hydrolase [Flavobacterium sp. HSC-32F16]MCP2029350.1 CubicO group peptidase (beta-lactamase class C family) [Flavobacterium sp. HSC-32F16]
MKKVNSFLVLVICICFSSVPVFAQLTSSQIDVLMESALTKFNVAGASIAVVKDGKIIHLKGYGEASVETKKAVNENTNFQIASNSKAFTTTALSILEDEGKLKWTDKVRDYLPEFKMYNDYVTENFNIQDLLTHRSGLGLGVGDLMFFPDGSNFTIKDVLTSFQYFKPVSAFRTKFDYDNLLYVVAGEVIARVSGMSYEEFVQKRIIAPLQMNNTFVGSSLIKDKSNFAVPHSSESGTIKTIDGFGDQINAAAGGIFSNAADMAKWMTVRLNKGQYGEDSKARLFSLKNHNEMWRIHTVQESDQNPRYNFHFNGYGLGWQVSDEKGNLKVSHTGGLPGMLSIVTMYPDLNLGIVILTNTENGGAGLFSAVSNTISDSYLGLDDFGWTDKLVEWMKEDRNTGDDVTKKVWEKVKLAKNVKIKKEDFIGVYADKWFGEIEVFEKNKQLWFKSYRSPKLNGPMAFYNANTFAVKWEYQGMNCDAFAMFSLDENGKAQSIKMKGISPNIDFSFDFHDLDLTRVR